MVLGRDDDVLHASVLGHAHPGFGIVLHRVELLCILLILRYRDLCIVHDPFADIWYLLALVSPRRNGVDTPVDKQPEPGFTPPGHARITLLHGLVVVGALEGH
jgi:hypothetical protein